MSVSVSSEATALTTLASRKKIRSSTDAFMGVWLILVASTLSIQLEPSISNIQYTIRRLCHLEPPTGMTVDTMDNIELHGQYEITLCTEQPLRQAYPPPEPPHGSCWVLSHLHDAGTSINGPGVESGTADSGWQAESRGTTQHTTAALQKWERTRYSAESRDDVSLFEESLGCPATRICPRLVDPDGTYGCTAVLLFFCSSWLHTHTHT